MALRSSGVTARQTYQNGAGEKENARAPLTARPITNVDTALSP